MPRVSVVIPAYNAAWCIRRAVASVLAQTYRDFELIVVDDGSDDETGAVLAAFGDRLRVVSKPNEGLSSARNAGIAAAGGEFVAFLDTDDCWLPPKLEAQVRLMDARPELALCSTATWVEGPDGHGFGIWSCPEPCRDALENIFRTNAYVAGSGSSAMVRRNLFTRVGYFDETLRGLEDVDMWMRLASVGEYACIPDVLTVIMKRPGSLSTHLDLMRSSALTVMKKNRGLLPPRLRGRFWRTAYVGVLADFAKWEYREGRRLAALLHLLQGLLICPADNSRLVLGLLQHLLVNDLRSA